ncbi:polysaccharide deacetylase family protein [Gillisia sp. CAL575]|uniref:polysaccharide deacetylase family protein n=1 Tax=Gillisia sp. CAL575 TaxID=985255 RepID=UPI00039D8AA0|nr:polysaccharide deacetylase family protein [Gillisia sp. CAL575]
MFEVLVYHKIHNVINFERQIVFLKKKYTILNLDKFKENIRRNDDYNKPSLLLTFDDGDISFYKNAFPILKKHNVPAVIFVITDLINTNKPFWWDAIPYYNIDVDASKLVWDVKKVPNYRRIEILQELKNKSGKKDLEYPQLTYNQLEEMGKSGISIANHSHTHPIFDQCSNQELRYEMEFSIKVLKERNHYYDVFAYPNGNFSLESEEIIRDSGIKFAFLFDHKMKKNPINPLRISRLMVDDTTSLWKFKFILSGLHSKILPLRKKVAKWL